MKGQKHAVHIIPVIPHLCDWPRRGNNFSSVSRSLALTSPSIFATPPLPLPTPPVGVGKMSEYPLQPISRQASAARCKSLCAERYNLPFLDLLKGKTASVSKSGKSNWLGPQLPRRAGCNETGFPCTVLTVFKVPRELPGGQSAGKVRGPELDYCPSSYPD